MVPKIIILHFGYNNIFSPTVHEKICSKCLIITFLVFTIKKNTIDHTLVIFTCQRNIICEIILIHMQAIRIIDIYAKYIKKLIEDYLIK